MSWTKSFVLKFMPCGLLILSAATAFAEGEPVIAVMNKDGTTRTFYYDTNYDGKITDNELNQYVRRETGTSSGGNFSINEVESPPTSETSNKAFKYSYVNSSGNTIQTNDKAKLLKAVPPGGSLTFTDPRGREIDINDKGIIKQERDQDGKILSNYGNAEKKANQTPEEAKKEKQAMTDPCHFSMQVSPDGKYRCQGTTNLIKGAEIGNAVLGTAGKTIVNTIGQTAAAKSQNGSMSSGYAGSAKMAKTTFTYETALTAMNLAATAALAKKTATHKQNAAELRAMSVNIDEDDATGKSTRIQKAINEQENQQNKANAATYVTALKGVESLSNAMTSKKIQKDAEKAANLSKQIETTQNKPGIVWDSSAALTAGNYDPNQAPLADGTATETSGSLDGSNPNGDTTTGGNTNLLGNGNDLSGGDNTGPEEHTPGAFKAAAGGGSSGGGGGGAGGGAAGGGSGGGASGEESKAGYASEWGTKERYESGGGAGAKGGSGKAGGKDDTGIDLNGLLAQFLPKTEEDLGPKNGILDFAGSGRAPAAEDESTSYLDKNADLFQRIHETMSEKNRKGHVGI